MCFQVNTHPPFIATNAACRYIAVRACSAHRPSPRPLRHTVCLETSHFCATGAIWTTTTIAANKSTKTQSTPDVRGAVTRTSVCSMRWRGHGRMCVRLPPALLSEDRQLLAGTLRGFREPPAWILGWHMNFGQQADFQTEATRVGIHRKCPHDIIPMVVTGSLEKPRPLSTQSLAW